MPYNRIEPKWKKIFSSLKKKAASDSGDGAQLEKSQDVWDILNDKYQASEFSRSETKTTSKDILLKILKKPSEPGEELSEEDFMEKVKAMNLDDRGQQEFLLDMDSIMNSLRVEKKPGFCCKVGLLVYDTTVIKSILFRKAGLL